MTVRVKGATAVSRLKPSVSPVLGAVAKLSTTVCGIRSRLTVVLTPWLSVAVSRKVRYEGYS
jgi:hypothetical protein